MWWLGHLVLILLVFGLGFSSREALQAWRALNRFLTHGSEDHHSSKSVVPQDNISAVQKTPRRDSNMPPADLFANMQAKADSDKLQALKSTLGTR